MFTNRRVRHAEVAVAMDVRDGDEIPWKSAQDWEPVTAVPLNAPLSAQAHTDNVNVTPGRRSAKPHLHRHAHAYPSPPATAPPRPISARTTPSRPISNVSASIQRQNLMRYQLSSSTAPRLTRQHNNGGEQDRIHPPHSAAPRSFLADDDVQFQLFHAPSATNDDGDDDDATDEWEHISLSRPHSARIPHPPSSPANNDNYPTRPVSARPPSSVNTRPIEVNSFRRPFAPHSPQAAFSLSLPLPESDFDTYASSRCGQAEAEAELRFLHSGVFDIRKKRQKVHSDSRTASTHQTRLSSHAHQPVQQKSPSSATHLIARPLPPPSRYYKHRHWSQRPSRNGVGESCGRGSDTKMSTTTTSVKGSSIHSPHGSIHTNPSRSEQCSEEKEETHLSRVSIGSSQDLMRSTHHDQGQSQTDAWMQAIERKVAACSKHRAAAHYYELNETDEKDADSSSDEDNAIRHGNASRRSGATNPSSAVVPACTSSMPLSTRHGRSRGVFPSWIWSRDDFRTSSSSFLALTKEACLRILKLYPDERVEKIHCRTLGTWINDVRRKGTKEAMKDATRFVQSDGIETDRVGSNNCMSSITSRQTRTLPSAVTSFLTLLPPSLFNSLLRVLSLRSIVGSSKDGPIWKQGTRGEDFVIVVSGRVRARKIHRDPESGHEIETVQTLYPGSVVAHDSCLGDLPSHSHETMLRRRARKLWHRIRCMLRKDLSELGGGGTSSGARGSRSSSSSIGVGFIHSTLDRLTFSTPSVGDAEGVHARARIFGKGVAATMDQALGKCFTRRGIHATRERMETLEMVEGGGGGPCTLLSVSYHAWNSIIAEYESTRLNHARCFLSSMPFFASWSFDRLNQLYSLLVPRDYTKGEVIWRQGETASEVGFIEVGSLMVQREILVTESHRTPAMEHGTWGCEETTQVLTTKSVDILRARQVVGEECAQVPEGDGQRHSQPVRDYLVRCKSDHARVWMLHRRHLPLLRRSRGWSDHVIRTLHERKVKACELVASMLREKYPTIESSCGFNAVDWRHDSHVDGLQTLKHHPHSLVALALHPTGSPKEDVYGHGNATWRKQPNFLYSPNGQVSEVDFDSLRFATSEERERSAMTNGNNGVLGTAETVRDSGSDGTSTFLNLQPGSVHVRYDPPFHMLQAFAPTTVTVLHASTAAHDGPSVAGQHPKVKPNMKKTSADISSQAGSTTPSPPCMTLLPASTSARDDLLPPPSVVFAAARPWRVSRTFKI